MATISLWRGLLGLKDTAIEEVRHDGDVLVIEVRPMSRQRGRCGRCRRRSPRYDAGRRRRWRSLDQGTTTPISRPTPRGCAVREHGWWWPRAWAAHGAGHTHTFDAQVAWLATQARRRRPAS